MPEMEVGRRRRFQRWEFTTDDMVRLLSGESINIHPRSDLGIEIRGRSRDVRKLLMAAAQAVKDEAWARELRALVDVFLEERARAIEDLRREELAEEPSETDKKAIGIAVRNVRAHVNLVIEGMMNKPPLEA